MILKILLLIIFFQLFLECFREGMIGSKNTSDDTSSPQLEDIEYPILIKGCSYEKDNVKFPYYNQTNNTYTNKNNFLYNNFQNILKAASTSCS